MGSFYEPAKDATMARLNKGFHDFNRSVDREPNAGLGMKIIPEDSYDYKRAIET